MEVIGIDSRPIVYHFVFGLPRGQGCRRRRAIALPPPPQTMKCRHAIAKLWRKMAFPPEEKSWKNSICLFVHMTNRPSTWRNYLYEKAEQNKYTNRSGQFLTFIPSNKTDTQKSSREQKTPSHRLSCICEFVYLAKKITA